MKSEWSETEAAEGSELESESNTARIAHERSIAVFVGVDCWTWGGVVGEEEVEVGEVGEVVEEGEDIVGGVVSMTES